jgi:2-iminobutanoate/2-iminopropanoate deaminase
MIRQVSTNEAPAAIGPYSQAITHGGLVYCSGQIALDAATGVLIEGDVQAETRKVLQNLGNVLTAAGTEMGRVLKVTVFLSDMTDFAAVNEVYTEFFPGDRPPARACVQAAGLPKGVRVEIDCIAAVA